MLTCTQLFLDGVLLLTHRCPGKCRSAPLRVPTTQDLKRRKYETEEEKEELVPQLREVSRQEYLKKREEQKVAELEDKLRDEELLFV